MLMCGLTFMLRFHIQKCDTSNSGSLAGEEIERFYNLLTHREEIDVIYGAYAKTTGFMSSEDLVSFLMKEQMEKVTLADAHKIIEKYEPDENGQYLLIWCSVLFRGHQVVPLTHLPFRVFQPKQRCCWPKMASSCTCVIQTPWFSIQSTRTCIRTWASLSTTTSSPPHTTPTSWRISSKGPAAQRVTLGNCFIQSLLICPWCLESFQLHKLWCYHRQNLCSLQIFIQLSHPPPPTEQ